MRVSNWMRIKMFPRSGHITILRHLLSTDSPEEKKAWCYILNKALENLRAWDTVHR